MASSNQADVQFVLEHASENWHYLAWIILAIVVCVIAMRRYGPPPPGIWGVISRSCRIIALAVVIFMLAGPAWQTTEHHTQPGQVSIAVDLSASMQRDDTPDGTPRLAQAHALYQAINNREEAPNNTYNWKSICANGVAIDIDKLRNDQLQAAGNTSRLARELLHIAANNQQDVLILISDGRSTDERELESIAAQLRERGIEVLILATGSDAINPELDIVEVIGNRDVARGERQPFIVNVSTRGLIGKELSLSISNSDGEELNSSTAAVDGDEKQNARLISTEIPIDAVLHEEGDQQLHFTVEGPDGLRSTISLQVRVSERKLRVLMLAHHPRYEMRYLRNALDRDHTVEIHSYLADGRWRRWGPDRFGPGTLPLQASELKDYDAVILGDLSSISLSMPAQENLVRSVRQFGLGLIWIPGERGGIAEFRGTALGKLIPAALPDRDSIQRSYLKGVVHEVSVTEIGEQFLNPGAVAWEDLPNLIGNCPFGDQDEMTKGTQVLMTGADDTPLIISRPYSSGRVTLIGIDDTWRWRKDVGDFYLHRFHSALLRYTSSGRQLHRKPWLINTTPSRARLGEAVQINVSPSGPVTDAATLPESVTLSMQRNDEEKIIRLHRAPNDNSYGISTSFFQAGNWQLEMLDGLSPSDVRNDELTILSATAENSDPRLDRPALERLASATGGSIFTDPVTLAKAIPDRQRRRSERRNETAWDSMWFLIIVASLFCVEWAMRRHFRLP